MCIIIVKPKGEPLPDKDKLLNCFLNNNDGAGFSFVKDNRVYLSKGYGRFKPFMRAIKRHIKEDTPAILHFRIASVGKVTERNCHPFIISEDKREVEKTTGCTRSPVFAHNGSFAMKETANGKSDTRQYARIIGDPIIKNNIFKNNNLTNILANSIGFNKLAFMNRKGELLLLGDFEEEKGVYFSNRTFNYRRTVISPTWKTEKEKKEKAERARDEALDDYYNNYGYGGGYGGYGNDYLPKNQLDKTIKEADKKAIALMAQKEKEEVKDVEKEVKEERKKVEGLFEKAVEEQKKVEKVASISLLSDGRGRVKTSSECEICKNSKEETDVQVYYFKEIDSSICTFCWQLYFGGFKEVVDGENEKK